MRPLRLHPLARFDSLPELRRASQAADQPAAAAIATGGRRMKRKPNRRARIDWSSTPLAFIEPPPPCPHCDSRSPPIYVRAADQGDGSILRKLICQRCSGAFRIVQEALPSSGNQECDDLYDNED